MTEASWMVNASYLLLTAHNPANFLLFNLHFQLLILHSWDFSILLLLQDIFNPFANFFNLFLEILSVLQPKFSLFYVNQTLF